MTTRVKHPLSALLATSSIIVALALAGCGGSPGTGHQAPAQSGPSTTQTHTAPPVQSATSDSSAGIPQGNGGDQDADNNGGPSDGDGNI